MLNPKLEIDSDVIYRNAVAIVTTCREHGLLVTGVTKAVCALPAVVEALLAAGINKLADSRMQNIIKLRQAGFTCELALLRIPMLSEAPAAVQYADLSYHSEIKVLEAFNKAAAALDKTHRVVLMVEVGDLREGILPEDLDAVVEQVLEMPHLQLAGLAMNVGCYGGVLPSLENTGLLVQLQQHLQRKFGLALAVVSGGSTSTLKLLEEGLVAKGVNEVRVGEAIFLGTGASAGGLVRGTRQDALQLSAEIVELKTKPSVPAGVINKDAFGKKPCFVDKGWRKRAILAVGRQDVPPESLVPVLPGLEILGASSDHLIVDVTACDVKLQVGDEVSFRLDYGGLLAAMTSPYVYKATLNRSSPHMTT